jgi:hypothetical protein
MDQVELMSFRRIVLGAGALLVLTFCWAGFFVFWKMENSEIALPVVIIAGVTVLLMVLGMLTFGFSVLKLTNKHEALGLPSGSVRAVIALMLLVIFAIVAIFLYSDVSSNGRLQKIEGVATAEQESELRKQLDVVLVAPDAKNAANVKYPATVYYRAGSRAAEDLAKQLIVLLGTLVTAVSSFYFGSSSTAAAQKSKKSDDGGGPNATNAAPNKLLADGTAQPLRITGTNLEKVGTVKLTLEGQTPIAADADSLDVKDTEVNCKITIKTDAAPGQWEVVVSDNANNDSRIPKGVTIEKPAAPSALPEKAGPQAKDVVQKQLEPRDTPQDLTVTGANLANVKAVSLTLDGQSPIVADPASISAEEAKVDCKITIMTGTVEGRWDVMVTDDAGKSSTVANAVSIKAAQTAA